MTTRQGEFCQKEANSKRAYSMSWCIYADISVVWLCRGVNKRAKDDLEAQSNGEKFKQGARNTLLAQTAYSSIHRWRHL